MLCVEDAAILVDEGRILDLGPRSEVSLRAPADVTVVDMKQRVAIPCFVDPHTHLVFAGERADEFNQRLHGATYVEIAARGGGIKATVQATRKADPEQLYQAAKKRLDLMLLHGIATVEGKTGYGLDFDTEMRQLDVMDRLDADHPIDLVQTFMGAHEIPPEFAGRPSDYIELLNRDTLPEVKKRGTVTYVDIFCEKGVFELADTRKHLEAARDLGFQLRMHADELEPLSGAGLAADLGAVSADHLVHTSHADMLKMADAGTMATLLPGTSFFLRGPYADAKKFLESGCAVALSTDFNPGSSHTVSQSLMMALACMCMGLSFEQSFLSVTLNAAAAIGKATEIGTLEVGKRADIAFLDVPSALHLVYFWGVNHVCDVMKSGEFVVRHRILCG